jgi:hypothetical protein
MKSLRDLLGQALGRHKLREHYDAEEILRACAEEITARVPENIAQAVVPKTYRHGTIFLHTQNPAAAQEFRFSEHAVLKALRARHPDKEIVRFRYLLGSLDRNGEEVA